MFQTIGNNLRIIVLDLGNLLPPCIYEGINLHLNFRHPVYAHELGHALGRATHDDLVPNNSES